MNTYAQFPTESVTGLRWIKRPKLSLVNFQDCGHVLDSRIKGSECWPIRHHVLCYKCYRRRQSESESEGDD